MRNELELAVCFMAITCATPGWGAENRLPLQDRLDSMDRDCGELVACWITSHLRQGVEERRIRDRVTHDARFRRAFHDYLIDCCVVAFVKSSGKTNAIPSADSRWAAGLVVLQVPRDLLLEAIVPEMERSQRLAGVLEGSDRDLAQYLEFQPDNATPVSFQAYEAYLRGHIDNPPEGLIAYMFRRRPGEALKCMTNVFSKGDSDSEQLLWADHLVSDWLFRRHHGKPTEHIVELVQSEVSRVADHPTWWARLYAAETVRQHRELHHPETMAKLKNDKHPRVRGVMQLAGEPSKQSARPKPEAP